MSTTEVRGAIKKELEKFGPHDESDIRSVLNKYLSKADQEKPINTDEIGAAIQSHFEGRAGAPSQGPQPSVGAHGKDIKNPSAPPPKNEKVKQGEWVPPVNPKNPTFFEKIRLKLRRYGIKSLTRGSRNWLTDNVNKVSRAPSKKLVLESGQTIADALIGNMFMYYYDAKHKDTLPYWDKFPLIFVIEIYPDGWLGLNLHYLPITLRTKLFDKLLQFANDKSLDKITKLRLSYGLLKNVAKFPEVQPTIKRYLSSHVKSQLVKIHPVDWEIAVFLPVEQFQKEKKEFVWKESRKMIRKAKGKR
jgi:hypothetical protein